MKIYILILVGILFVINSCKDAPIKKRGLTNETIEVENADKDIDIYANPNTFKGINKLKIGDYATPLKIDKWYNSVPLEEFKKGRVYVIEFWASWCQPCRKSIPHLNKLQKEFSNDLTIIGVAASESKNSKALEKLLELKKGELSYPVAYTKDKETFKNYMWAANNTGLPWAFIIDRKGRIAWWGQPFYSQFEPILRSVINDSYILSEGEVPIQADSNKMKKYWSIQESFWSEYSDQNWDKTIVLGRELKEANNELFYYEMATIFEVLFLHQNKEEEALTFAKKLEKGLLSNIPEGLSAMAFAISEKENLSDKELKYGNHLVNKVASLTLNQNLSVKILQAKFLFKSGDKKSALEILKELSPDNEDLKKEVEDLILKINVTSKLS